MPDVVVRPYRDGDVPVMMNLIREAFAEYRGLLNPPSSAERKTEAVLRAELAGAGAFVAELAGEPVGCVLWHPKDTGIYVDRLSVLPKARGRGIARRLMTAVEDLAHRRGASAMSLSVRLMLTIQHDFYRRLGFEFDSYGVHEGYSEPTFLRLRKPLRT